MLLFIRTQFSGRRMRSNAYGPLLNRKRKSISPIRPSGIQTLDCCSGLIKKVSGHRYARNELNEEPFDGYFCSFFLLFLFPIFRITSKIVLDEFFSLKMFLVNSLYDLVKASTWKVNSLWSFHSLHSVLQVSSSWKLRPNIWLYQIRIPSKRLKRNTSNFKL